MAKMKAPMMAVPIDLTYLLNAYPSLIPPKAANKTKATLTYTFDTLPILQMAMAMITPTKAATRDEAYYWVKTNPKYAAAAPAARAMTMTRPI